MDSTDIYRISHLTTAKYTFFSGVHGKFSKTDHILGHKKQLLANKKKTDIILYILSDDNDMKLEIKTKRTVQKLTNT